MDFNLVALKKGSMGVWEAAPLPPPLLVSRCHSLKSPTHVNKLLIKFCVRLVCLLAFHLYVYSLYPMYV